MTSGARKLRAWRHEAGLTQAQAAARVAVRSVTWSQWELGRKRPSITMVVRIAALTAASQHAVSVHDWIETDEEREERRRRRRSVAA